MALNRPASIRVAGFCGLPVKGAAAMVSPLFRLESGDYFTGNPDSPAGPNTISVNEAREHQAAGYLSITEAQWEYVSTGIILYAHPLFLQPSQTACVLPAKGLVFDKTLNIYLNYLPRAEATEILYSWGTLLLHDAQRLTSGRRSIEDLERSVDSAQRILFCAPPPEHKSMRFDAFVLLAAGFRALGRSVDRIYREASLDFDEIAVARMRQRAESRAAGLIAYPPSDSRCPDPADGRRIRVEVRRARD